MMEMKDIIQAHLRIVVDNEPGTDKKRIALKWQNNYDDTDNRLWSIIDYCYLEELK